MNFKEASDSFIDLFTEPEGQCKPVGVKLIPKGKKIPDGTRTPEEYQGILWCEAVRIADENNEVVVINKDNVGCPAAAIALGLVDQYSTEPLGGVRKYTDMMSETASPSDFTNGFVYACNHSENMQFSLFGDDDTGRYETLGTAQKAIRGMISIQPDIMDAAVAYTAQGLDAIPDVVIIAVNPRQALLAIQGYNFITGCRFEMSTIGIRGVCADLTAYPFVKQQLNGSFFCLGARAVGGWGGNLLGLGMPFSIFHTMVEAMERSRTGFPYGAYPE